MEAAGGRGRQEPEEEEGTLPQEAVAEPQQEVAAEVSSGRLRETSYRPAISSINQ